MKLKIVFIILLVFLSAISCSSSKEIPEQKSEVKTSESVITSSHLKVIAPTNWREITDNHEPLFEIWLVRDDNNAAIGFIPIHLNDNITIDNESEQLNLIEKMLLAKKGNGNTDFELVESKSFLATYPNKSIKYYLGDHLQNSIIFGNNEVYYECLLYFHDKYEPEEKEIEGLLELQKQIIIDATIK